MQAQGVTFDHVAVVPAGGVAAPAETGFVGAWRFGAEWPTRPWRPDWPAPSTSGGGFPAAQSGTGFRSTKAEAIALKGASGRTAWAKNARAIATTSRASGDVLSRYRVT